MILPCNCILFIQRLQGFLLPCPFKYLTGIDCPGCGFQRSVLALLNGNLHQSFALYPSTLPLLLSAAYTFMDNWLKLDTQQQWIKKTLYIITGCFITASYIIKCFTVKMQ